MSVSSNNHAAKALLMAIPAMFGVAQAQQQVNSTVLEEVTVSAQRRDANIQTVRVSVTALDPAVIERRQIFDNKQIVFNVPNLTGNSNVGQSTATTFFMRGVGTTENLADIERIEVRRGPYGTLYGRNTNGGAIKIVTKKPSAEPEFAVRGSYGNYSRWDLKLSGNTPITDKVFVRANFLTQQGDGYIRNTTLNGDVNDLDYVGGRIALRALPAAGQNISPDRSFSDTTPKFGVNWQINDDLFNTLTIAGVFTVQTADATIEGVESEFTWRASQLQAKAGFSIERLLAAAPLLPRGAAETGDFTLVNASVGYRWNDGKYEVSASCTSCRDEEYFEGGTYIGAYAGVWTGAPHFYRLNLGIKL